MFSLIRRIYSSATGHHIRKWASLRFLTTESTWARNCGPSESRLREDQVPSQADVLIVGGGLIGWSVAFWIRWTTKFSVTLVERDPTYARSASVLGLGSIRQQFSEPEHIQMSLFGSEFLRNIKDYLTVLDDTPLDIQFNPHGCLLLTDASQSETMKRNFHLQTELGCKVELLGKQELQSRWPWLNVSDIELGCYGYENEGWFDPWLLLKALRIKCHTLGVNYVVGEVVDFELAPYETQTKFADLPKRAPVIRRPLKKAVISVSDGTVSHVSFSTVVNAAGPWAADVARLAEIGSSDHIPLPLPVEPRLQYVYAVRPRRQTNFRSSRAPSDDSVNLPEPSLDMPFVVDCINRMFVERRGLSGEYLVYSNDEQAGLIEPAGRAFEFDVDYTLFKQKLGEQLGHRIPVLASAELTCAWTAVCDYNTVDRNLIIGRHPYHTNFLLCNGSSGHGSQHAIAIGRALCELIIYGHYRTIDLTRFSFDRLYLNEPVLESNAF